jgi:hypothetical protein
MYTYLIAALLALVFLMSSAAKSAEPEREDAKVVYKKKTSIDFSDVNIEGELVKPTGTYIGIRKQIGFGNFIKVRANFRDKLSDSADNI